MGADVTPPVRFEASLRPSAQGRAWLDVFIVSGGVTRHLGSTLLPAEEAAAGALRLTGATAEEERAAIIELVERIDDETPAWTQECLGNSIIRAIEARGTTKGEAA